METRNLGLIRALGWERTSHGVEFRCVTELLAPARVAVEAAGPRALRVRITAGASPLPKAQTYVVARPDADAGRVETSEGRVTVRTSHLVVEASLDPWQLTFRAADGRLLTHGPIRQVISEAGLTTWAVSTKAGNGARIAELSRQLAGKPGIDAVAAFGAGLHVGGRDAAALEHAIAAYRDDPLLTWQRTEPNLEDVFIDLVARAEIEQKAA